MRLASATIFNSYCEHFSSNFWQNVGENCFFLKNDFCWHQSLSSFHLPICCHNPFNWLFISFFLSFFLSLFHTFTHSLSLLLTKSRKHSSRNTLSCSLSLSPCLSLLHKPSTTLTLSHKRLETLSPTRRTHSLVTLNHTYTAIMCMHASLCPLIRNIHTLCVYIIHLLPFLLFKHLDFYLSLTLTSLLLSHLHSTNDKNIPLHTKIYFFYFFVCGRSSFFLVSLLHCVLHFLLPLYFSLALSLSLSLSLSHTHTHSQTQSHKHSFFHISFQTLLSQKTVILLKKSF